MTNGTQNGHESDAFEGIGVEALSRLGAIGSVRKGAGDYNGTNGSGSSESRVRGVEDAATPPPQQVLRHPDDPSDALTRAAIEVCDPERIREFAVYLGQALFALPPEFVEAEVTRIYAHVHDVRGGAEVMQAQREASHHVEISSTTKEAVVQILLEARAAELKADRLTLGPLVDCETEIDEARRELEAAEDEVERLWKEFDQERKDNTSAPPHSPKTPEDHAPAREGAGARGWTGLRNMFARRKLDHNQPYGNLFSRLHISLDQAKFVLPFEVGIFTLLLAEPVAQITNTSWQFGALIALGVSVPILGASALAGLGIAALRPPGRLVGLLLVGAYLLIMLKFAGGLEDLRAFDEGGTETLTAATLAACFVGAITGYALAAWADYHSVEGEEELTASPARVARDALRRAKDLVLQWKASLNERLNDREQVQGEIERLLTFAAEAPVRMMARLQEGTKADVRIATIQATAATAVGQERAAARWSVDMALLAHTKIRAEQIPDREFSMPERIVPDAERRDLSKLHKVAIGLVTLGALGTPVIGWISLAISAGIAFLLFLIGEANAWHTRRSSQAEADEQRQRPAVGATASVDDRHWKHHPDHTVSRTRDGGAKGSERHE